jgi:hypothetical protein
MGLSHAVNMMVASRTRRIARLRCQPIVVRHLIARDANALGIESFLAFDVAGILAD